ncbi:hypothetical protein HRF84_08105 [Klebsiella variicola]|uniref:hypothetical protein n=1 Tax=Klebsiella variicola TaxID=244366 RepID=UPI0015617F06|nr:hypothetical protein [Klebsiella variicola]NRE95004.1 hypothetical protein [Klebsiella variicola]
MLEFFKEVYSSVKSNSSERVKNYYFGAFLFSWLTINWKFVLTILFSESKIEERIDKASLYLTNYKAFLLPFTISACICIFLPAINMIIAYAQKKPNNYLRGDSHQIKASRLRAEIETETLRAERDSAYRKKSTSESLEVQTLQAQIQESKDVSSKLSEENSALTEQLSNINKQLNVYIQEVEHLKRQLVKTEATNENLEKTARKLQAETMNLKTSLDNSQVMLEEKKKELEENKNKSKIDINSFLSEISQLRNKNEELLKEMDKLKGEHKKISTGIGLGSRIQTNNS